MKNNIDFDPEIYNSTSELLMFRFFDGKGYRKFAEYTIGKESHIFVCDNQRFTIITDAFTKEEATRMALSVSGLAAIAVISLKNMDLVSKNQIYSWIKT